MPASMLRPPCARPTSLRNACSSGKPRRHDRAVDGDRPAGEDERLGRRVRAQLRDDRGPGRQRARRGAEAPPASRRRGGGRRWRGRARRRRSAVAARGRRRSAASPACDGVAGWSAVAGRVAGVVGATVGRSAAASVRAGGSAAARRGGPRAGAGVRRAARSAGDRSPWRRDGRGPGSPRRLRPIGTARARAGSGGRRCPPGSGRWPRSGDRPAASSAGSWRRRRRVGQPGHELEPDGLDDLVEQRPDVATALVERVEQGDARRRVAAHQVVDERLDDLGVGQAEQVADVRLVDPLGRRGEQLVEHRFGVAHPAGGEPGDEADGRRRRRRGRRPPRMRRSLPSISGTVRRRTSKRWSRDRIAGGKPDGSVEANMKITKSGGSSSDLRSAFQASRVIWCASSRM